MLFFKRRMSIPIYCETALGLLFTDEQTDDWITFKMRSSDPTLRAADNEVFVNQMRAAHIQLLCAAINKTYMNMDLSSELYDFINAYLSKARFPELGNLKDAYNSAFGSSSVDGVLAMARLLSRSVSAKGLSEESVLQIRADMYASLSSFYDSFKKIKLVTS